MDKKDNSRVFIIDNNNFVNEKTISVFKDMPFKNGLKEVEMIHGVRINNVMNGRILYSLVDVPNNYYNGEIKSSYPIESIKIKVYNKQGGVIRDDVLLHGNNIGRQTTVNRIVGSFDYSYPVDVEVYVHLNSGYLRALFDSFIRDKNEHPRLDMSYLRCYLGHCGGGGGGGPVIPSTSYTSLFEHMKVMVNYNITAGNQKDFFMFKGKFNEFKEGGGVYSFKQTFEIDNSRRYSRIAIGLNEDIAVDFSHYNKAWTEDNIVKPNLLSAPHTEKAPCTRTHITGNLKKETILDEIEDFTTGELLEEPSISSDVTESNIMSSHDYFDMSIGKLINGTVTIYSHKIFFFEDGENNEFVNLNLLLRKDENKLYLTVEFLFSVAKFYGFEDDRLRFKSDFCIGALFMV